MLTGALLTCASRLLRNFAMYYSSRKHSILAHFTARIMSHAAGWAS